jgi:hypothetical protein
MMSHKNNILSFLTTTELIQKSKRCISTISTVLLECEMFGKPTYVYENKGTKCLCDRLKKKDTFRNFKELDAYFSKPAEKKNLESGCLLPYDNKKVLECFEKFFKNPEKKAIMKTISEYKK